MRSPNYPAVGLAEVVSMAQAVWVREKRSYVPPDAAVQAWGYSGLSGNARTKIAAMKKYGLFEENENGDLRLSDLAVHILHNPPDSPERLTALREAALSPELFAELQQTHPHASEETLRSYLMTRKGFSDTGAESCVKAFKDTQEIAKLNDMNAPVTAPQPPQPSVIPPGSSGAPVHNQQPMTNANPIPIPPKDESVTTFRWPLSRGVVAEVRFIGDAKPAHLDLLKQYLDVAKGAMKFEEQEPERPIRRKVSFASNETVDEPE